MATLLIHFEAIRDEWREAFADRKISFAEALQIAGVVINAASCTWDKLDDKSQFAQLVAEAEELYDAILDPAEIDIPKVPEWAEAWVLGIGRDMIRPGLERLVDAVDGGA